MLDACVCASVIVSERDFISAFLLACIECLSDSPGVGLSCDMAPD